MPPWALTALTCLLVVTIFFLLRLRAILPPRSRPKRRTSTESNGSCSTPYANKTIPHLVIILGSGGHTAEMIAMLDRATTKPECSSPEPITSEYAQSVSPDGRGGKSNSTKVGSKDGYLDWSRVARRTWIVSAGDSLSASIAHKFEQDHASKPDSSSVKPKNTAESTDSTARRRTRASQSERKSTDVAHNYTIETVPRARKIHQSLLSAPLSCAQCLFACLHVLTRRSVRPARGTTGSIDTMYTTGSTDTTNTTDRDPSPTLDCPSNPAPETEMIPDLILSNGPATATIAILACLVLRAIDYKSAETDRKLRTVYVESFARVRSLSLSGRVLLLLADRVLVQWAGLEGVGGRGEFLGVLV